MGCMWLAPVDVVVLCFGCLAIVCISAFQFQHPLECKWGADCDLFQPLYCLFSLSGELLATRSLAAPVLAWFCKVSGTLEHNVCIFVVKGFSLPVVPKTPDCASASEQVAGARMVSIAETHSSS